MMPKWVCNGCRRVFYGWGGYYKYKAGASVICPECEGHLVHTTEDGEMDDRMAHFSDSDAA
ncbi:MAG: hypothetical protein ACE5EI_06060 [Thermodesulfobacteriota bacterium]